MDLNVLVSNHDGDARNSPMGGKHQRSLSLSAKWASDKSMAVEYLRRQRDVMTWIESVLEHEVPTTDLFEALKSGVVLREMMQTLFPDNSHCMSPISRKYSKRMAPWKERENISVFLRQCKSIGMNDLSLFCTDDLYEGTNMVQVLFCLQHFKMFSEEHAGHQFMPVAKNQPAEFSNQELEMAMSKIEQAGVDVTALQDLISTDTSSVVAEKMAIFEKESNVRAASESTNVSSNEEKPESTKEKEPAQSERPDEKANVKVQPEVCNQASEDEQENADIPAADDDLNPEQESGSDAGDNEGVVLAEDSAVLKQETSVDEVDPPSTRDQETMAVVQQILSYLSTAIEESEAQLNPTQEISAPKAESEAHSVEIASIPEEAEQEVTAKAVSDAKKELNADTVDQANVDIKVTEGVEAPAAELTDAPIGSAPAGEVTSIDLSPEATEQATEQKEDATPHNIQEEELESKAMSKCMCGKCAIM